MGITTGYYTLENNSTKMCVENPKANNVSMTKCSTENSKEPSMIWKYDDVQKSLCNHKSKACMVHNSATPNTVTLLPFDNNMPEMKWIYDPKGQTICNKKTNMCLETGGKTTPGNKFGVSTLGDSQTLKWSVKPAMCQLTESFPTVKLNPQSHATVCKGLCMNRKGNYSNVYENRGVTGFCKCDMPTACTL